MLQNKAKWSMGSSNNYVCLPQDLVHLLPCTSPMGRLCLIQLPYLQPMLNTDVPVLQVPWLEAHTHSQSAVADQTERLHEN